MRVDIDEGIPRETYSWMALNLSVLRLAGFSSELFLFKSIVLLLGCLRLANWGDFFTLHGSVI